jgi:formylglycine-generating enzyme required for sulfatase activity
MGVANGVDKPTQATLEPYLLDRTEVTVAAFAGCVARGACSAEGLSLCGSDANWQRPEREAHPINCVTWDQARAFCADRGGRLPTEAEWELAARGTDGRTYPWGDRRPDATLAHFDHPIGGTTAPADAFPAGASPFGVLQMAGNVWEWVADWYGPLPGGAALRPRGPRDGRFRVVRGGGFSSLWGAGLRAVDRESSDPQERGRNLGFRCAYESPG